MNKIKWLFFDVGSTLVDESKVYERRLEKIADAACISIQTVSDKALEYYQQNKKGDLETARFYNVTLPKWETEYEALYPDSEKVLKCLKDKYKIGVIANQSLGTADRLAAFGILKYIDLVVASAEEGVSKPGRKIFEIALERSRCPSDKAFMIGDRIDNDIIPAKNLGMKTLWIRQGFGGLWKIQSDDELPNFIANDLNEASEILEWYENSKSLLETTMNTRDLGGHLCADGKRTVNLRILRSDKQNYPNQRDVNFLIENGITTIIDVREEDVVRNSPNGFADKDDFRYMNFPIIEGGKVPESVEAVPDSYMKIAKSLSLKDIFTAIATSESGVMFNCSAGKDRTGVISAILLMLCGVSEEEIVEDYMLTKEYNRERFKMAAIHHPNVDLNIIIPRESYIKEFMRLFYEEFGSVEGYFKEIGVTEDIYKRLRRKLKEKY